jgi:hypothetical protein
MGVFLSPPPDVAAIVIHNDGGGVVDSYKNAVRRYAREHRRIEIRGSCRSACTLALAVPTTCVGAGAVLRWHHAYNPQTGAVVLSVTQEMLSMTPVKVRQAVGPFIDVNYTEGATLNYQQLISLGVPDCDWRPPETFATTSPAKDVRTTVDTVALSKEPSFLTRAHR